MGLLLLWMCYRALSRFVRGNRDGNGLMGSVRLGGTLFGVVPLSFRSVHFSSVISHL